jgi:hypothetical protein
MHSSSVIRRTLAPFELAASHLETAPSANRIVTIGHRQEFLAASAKFE